MDGATQARLKIAVIGSGISGLSAAWLLSREHAVTVFEKEPQPGGHSLTRDAPMAGGQVPVDMGFIVYNAATYPNLVALFDYLGVETQPSEMSFGVSLEGGAFEYSGGSLKGLVAQPMNALRPRLWSMIAELTRFYREAPRHLPDLERSQQSLGDYLDHHRYGLAFRRDHLLPMAAAIWSAPESAMLHYPAAAFIRFFENHGLLKLSNRPIWRTVTGGSRAYVRRLVEQLRAPVRVMSRVTCIYREGSGVAIATEADGAERFDHVVIATHADQALRLLADPTANERALLGAFHYTNNMACLHSDERLMPRRRAAWSSWSVLGGKPGPEEPLCVTYWMNRLQALPGPQNLFVTLNPRPVPRSASILHTQVFRHPLFDVAAMTAQRKLWSLQGQQNTWFCGAYFGAGFHEDGLQSGLAVAEALGGSPRPWTVANASGRIHGPTSTVVHGITSRDASKQ